MGGGLTFTASPAKKKGQVFVVKGSAPWYNYDETWYDVDRVTIVDDSISGQATVTCKRVTNMDAMFYSCSNLTSIDLSNFDTSKVTQMNGLFYNCNRLVSVDLSNLNTSKTIKMNDMFYGCKSISSLDVSSFDTSKVTSMSAMFFYCKSLTSLNLSNFNTSNATDMSYMFYSCSKLTSIDLSNFDTSKVTDMWDMFQNCSNLTTIKGIIDMKSCTNYGSIESNGDDTRMFLNCPKLRNVKIKNPPSGFNGAGLSSSQYTIVS